MRVEVRDALSDWVDITSEVPQGSVIELLLFLIFVKDIPEWIKTDVRMFADDTKVRSTIKKPDDYKPLQDDLDSLTAWSGKWKLEFNAYKCKIMHIGHDLSTKYSMTIMGQSGIYTRLRRNVILVCW